MKKRLLLFPFLFVFLTINIYGQNGQSATDLLEKVPPGPLVRSVNPFIGTGGIPWVSGFTFPGATVPFGMVRLSPDTAFEYITIPNAHTSGYYYADDQVRGFSHTRLSGTGAADGGHFLVIPTVGPVKSDIYQYGQFARFSHENEVAVPGYYAVKLHKLGIWAEMTATNRVGVHRYRFPKGQMPHLLINANHVLGDKGRSDQGVLRILPQAQEVEGSSRIFGSFSGRYGGVRAYFVARFSAPFTSKGTWKDGAFVAHRDQVEGDSVGVDLSFSEEIVELKLAISHVSIENARANLEMEVGAKNFDEVRVEAQNTWEKSLSSIMIEGASEEQKSIFYTSLYHSLLMPTTYTDVNGDYVGFDKQVHRADDFTYYTDMSLWDTFRTVHPLLVLIDPKRQRDMTVSLLKMMDEGGWLPRWPAGQGYTNSMLGTPADIMIADTYLKGIEDFDIEKAFRAMHRTAMQKTPAKSPFSGREGVEHYLRYQYCPAELMDEAVARTLEFAYADYAIALVAEKLGYTQEAKRLKKHSQFYRNLWNPATQYLQPRDTQGNFVEPFDPLMLTYFDLDGKYTNDYVEGSALQWRWGVPFDGKGLVSLFKSEEYFIEELNQFFVKTNPELAQIPTPYYWHGNQPDIHAVYLFNAAKRPDLTQKWARWIMDNKYSTGANGLEGNDDGGTISAWYTFSALGFYPVAGTDIYQIGTPLFARSTIQLANNPLTIIADNFAPHHIYIQRAYLNGEALDRSYLKHSEIAQGGVLRFEMGPEPSSWGTK